MTSFPLSSNILLVSFVIVLSAGKVTINNINWDTANIAVINKSGDSTFFLSYQELGKWSIYGYYYDTSLNQINKDPIIIEEYNRTHQDDPIAQGESQCTCNYNQNSVSSDSINNVMYAWIYEADPSYRIFYGNNNSLSTWYIDPSLKGGTQNPVCGCFPIINTFIFMAYNGLSFNDYIYYVDMDGNNINGSKSYNYALDVGQHLVQFLLPCISKTRTCDTYLLVTDLYGYLYSISSQNEIIRNKFLLQQQERATNVLYGISLSNELYVIYDLDNRIWFLDIDNATQLSINAENIYNYELTIDDGYGFTMFALNDLTIDQPTNTAYIALIWSTDSNQIYVKYLKVINNGDTKIVNVSQYGVKQTITDNIDCGIGDLQAWYVNNIGKKMIAAWDCDTAILNAIMMDITG